MPDKVKTGEYAVWRCILVDQSRATNMITPGTKWRVSTSLPKPYIANNYYRILMEGNSNS